MPETSAWRFLPHLLRFNGASASMHYSGENQNSTKECIPLLSDGDSCFRFQAATAGCVSA